MRLIDADALFDFLTNQLEKEVGFYSKGRNAGLNIARSALHDETSTPTIAPPPNDPLTLEELMQIDVGDDTLPVFVCLLDDTWPGGGGAERYAAVNFEKDGKTANAWAVGWDYPAEVQVSEYGKTWLAYRRRPGEGVK